MKTLVILQQLWRRRIVVGIALLVSIGAGAYITLGSRQQPVGVASSRVLVDTPNSIVADLDPSGAASLSLHAQLLADLIAGEPIREEIAKTVGIPLQSLVVVPPAAAGAAPVATPVAQAAPPPSGTSTLTIGVDSTLPLVSLSAQAPTEAAAMKLANGAVQALQTYLTSVAAEQKIPLSRQPVIKPLGTQSASKTTGTSRLLGPAVTIVLFGLFCYVLLVVTGIRQRVRAIQPVPEPELTPVEDDEPHSDHIAGAPVHGTRTHHPRPTRAPAAGRPELSTMREIVETVDETPESAHAAADGATNGASATDKAPAGQQSVADQPRRTRELLSWR